MLSVTQEFFRPKEQCHAYELNSFEYSGHAHLRKLNGKCVQRSMN